MMTRLGKRPLDYSLVMNGVILGDNDDGDHVPELGVECVGGCPTSSGRNQMQDTCPQGPLSVPAQALL